MKIVRLIAFSIPVIATVCLMASTSAVAGSYLFRASNVGNKFTGLLLAVTLKFEGDTVICRNGLSAGAIANVHSLGSFNIKFRECLASNELGSVCTVKSTSAKEGELLTTTLHALLGLVLPSGLGGLLISTVSGGQWMELFASCLPAGDIAGTLAGLLESSQIGKLVLDNLVYLVRALSKISIR